MVDELLSLEEVRQYLNLNQREIQSLIDRGRLDAFRLGGAYLRFRKGQVVDLKTRLRRYPFSIAFAIERLQEFWRFNNFYIVSLVVIAALIAWFITS